MSNPDNSAARNTMSEFERQCYDWGWADAQESIIKLLHDYGTMNYISESTYHELVALITDSVY
jgi:hypothetical protein